MSWADAVPALSSGAVDGQENPLTIFTVAKLHAAANQKYLTIWGYVADPLSSSLIRMSGRVGNPKTKGRSRSSRPGCQGEY